MSTPEKLLTVVIEAPDTLNRESEIFRRLIAARLLWENHYSLITVDEPLTTSAINSILPKLQSKYVIFMKDTHRVSESYMVEMLQRLSENAVFLAEPYIYMGDLPRDVTKTKIDTSYYYKRDTDIYGIAFNCRRLADALETLDDLDRNALYTAYRIYWSIENVSPLATGYSVASVTKVAIGIMVENHVQRLLPAIPTPSRELRIYTFRMIILLLRGLRESKRTQISIAHLREIIRLNHLDEFSDLAELLNPFELGFFKWLVTPTNSKYMFKQLTREDAYIIFPSEEEKDSSFYSLYNIQFRDTCVEIGKEYLPNEIRSNFNKPASYDFYSRSIKESSTILFFDRPMQADDNAEHLYSYFTKNHPEFSNVYFALNKNSKDWNRLNDRGFKLVHFFSPEFYELFLKSDLVVGSQIYSLNYRGKTLANSRFVYLQHGIQLNDMTEWVLSKHFDIFIATGKSEADYLSAIAPRETLNSGIPRLETLANSMVDAEHLLFMPTWRFNLRAVSTENFLKSEYFKSINSILTDSKLLHFLEKNDRKLLVQLHPNVEDRVDCFQFSERVQLSSLSYNEAISAAEFVFTDYSSVVLDAAFVGIPIAYYQWDFKDFFADQPYISRVDYVKDGLGPVFENHEQIIDFIVSSKYNAPDAVYDVRRKDFFEGVEPTQINSTIVERMLEL